MTVSDDDKPWWKKVPPARLGLWVLAGVVGLYFLFSGIIGIITS